MRNVRLNYELSLVGENFSLRSDISEWWHSGDERGWVAGEGGGGGQFGHLQMIERGSKKAEDKAQCTMVTQTDLRP